MVGPPIQKYKNPNNYEGLREFAHFFNILLKINKTWILDQLYELHKKHKTPLFLTL